MDPQAERNGLYKAHLPPLVAYISWCRNRAISPILEKLRISQGIGCWVEGCAQGGVVVFAAALMSNLQYDGFEGKRVYLLQAVGLLPSLLSLWFRLRDIAQLRWDFGSPSAIRKSASFLFT